MVQGNLLDLSCKATESTRKPLKPHIHVFVYPSPAGAKSIGHCECGATQLSYNSDRLLDGKGFTDTFNFQSNQLRGEPDNPVDRILEGKRTCHIFSRNY